MWGFSKRKSSGDGRESQVKKLSQGGWRRVSAPKRVGVHNSFKSKPLLLKIKVCCRAVTHEWLSFFKSIIYCSPTVPWVSSSLLDYVAVNSPKLLIREYHNFFPNKPRTWVPICMDDFQCENYGCYTRNTLIRVWKEITIHKLQGVSIGPGEDWDVAFVTLPAKHTNTHPGMELMA